MDLNTTYLGMKLPHPIIVGATEMNTVAIDCV